jgi:hypothetical protein
MTHAKAKGSTFERSIANKLSERFQEATGLAQAFRKSVDSGSYFGKSNAKRLLSTGTEHATFGDILTPRNYKFTLECKAYSTQPTLGSLIKQSCSILDGWFAQASADALNAGKIACVIVKFNHVPVIVFLPEGFNLSPILTYRGWDMITLADIPAMLRKLADRIEAEPVANVFIVLEEADTDDVDVYGYGLCDDPFHAAGVLIKAAREITP